MLREPITVSVLYRRVQRALDEEFAGPVLVTGEVRKLQVRSDGNCWFELVEPGGGSRGRDAALGVVCWARTYERVEQRLAQHGLALTEGSSVVAGGVVKSWATGRLQFDLQFIDVEAMVGRLAAQRAALREQLEREGLLDANRRRPWPLVPLRVGLVASRDSEGMRDFLGVLDASAFGFQVHWCHAAVQGAGAARQLAVAIDAVGAADVDAVAVVRGGGSGTDLVAFDTAEVARAIATCTRPVLVGIGHTGDRTLADELAHGAHATPTAVAHHLVRHVQDYAGDLEARLARVSTLAHRCSDRARSDLHRAGARLPTLARRALAGAAADTAGRTRAALVAATRHQEAARAGYDARRAQLRALDPQRSVERGYAIARRSPSGLLLRSVAQVGPGELVTVQLADGTVTARVERTEPQEPA